MVISSQFSSAQNHYNKDIKNFKYKFKYKKYVNVSMTNALIVN